MPYTDSTGTLLIDEIAAQSDVKKLEAAKQKLIETRDNLKQIVALNSEMAGPIASAIEESTEAMLIYVNSQIKTLEDTVNNIQGVVKTYEQKDQNVKNTINNTL